MSFLQSIRDFVHGIQALSQLQAIETLDPEQLYLVKIKGRVSHEYAANVARNLKHLNIRGIVCEDSMTFEPLDEAARYFIHADHLMSDVTARNIERSLKENGVKALVVEKGLRLVAQEFSFRAYHESIEVTVDYPEYGNNLVYPALGAVEEAGELAGKIKKLWRNCKVFGGPDIELGGEEATRLRLGAMKEVGDTLWYLDAACTELQTTLEECARINVDKLLGRKERGTINGEGDER